MQAARQLVDRPLQGDLWTLGVRWERRLGQQQVVGLSDQSCSCSLGRSLCRWQCQQLMGMLLLRLLIRLGAGIKARVLQGGVLS